jgi:hypothetical protein
LQTDMLSSTAILVSPAMQRGMLRHHTAIACPAALTGLSWVVIVVWHRSKAQSQGS